MDNLNIRQSEFPAQSATEHQGPLAPAAPLQLREHIIEVISDSGEGAQKCGQSFASIAAKMGNGIWTVEIIPAEIEPPPRSIAGASGNRIRIGSHRVTNGGDEADLAVAFNEQVLRGRLQAGALRRGGIILLENKWRFHRDPDIVAAYTSTYDEVIRDGYRVYEIPMEQICFQYTSNPALGKNMFVLGMLSAIYSMDLKLGRQQVAFTFRTKSEDVVDRNVQLLEAGYTWARESLDLGFKIPGSRTKKTQLVMNGNTALALGIMASGMEVCAMYPITPATSAAHYLSEIFEHVDGIVHQAEDEIAACAFAIGASYAGKCAVTITSGPGMSLKQELIGLAAMAEVPLVVINVQRGGPSTGQPTKVEQGDLLQAIFGAHGDAPRVVLAAANIEDCFYLAITARHIAETFNLPVVLLSDANLATAQQLFVRPQPKQEWYAVASDQTEIPKGEQPYEWDDRTGLRRRFIPGQPGGMHTLTGLAHDRASRVAYDPEINEEGIRYRSRKLASFQKTLATPTVYGDPSGDLLIVGWGSTKGVIEEAVDRARADGSAVSSLHLTYLQPMASGIGEILKRFAQVMTVEISWSDSLDDAFVSVDNRRYSNLAWLLRARYLMDVDCWSEVKGQPLKPGSVVQIIRRKLETGRPHV
ncbi:MAG: 2-oxoacid:acceptor oxidoreductase subunit alpha [Betaproteobacteria bacterium]|nr:2-oxoacid:acceptor oxidoreductase subunit alpha [Gammaproteobacteria bacterium]MDH3435711.1 2-oxoacid:acceptor oxidoreductase subunit alpha [Betaproteobacteria bacterium]